MPGLERVKRSVLAVRDRVLNGPWGPYAPRPFWERWGETFIQDEYQRGLYWQHEWIADHLRAIAPPAVLEVGCGFGRNLRFLRERLDAAVRTVGVDLSQSMLDHARRYLAPAPPPLLRADVCALPFRDAAFPAVLVHGVFMHVPPDRIARAMQEVIRTSGRHVLCVEQNYSGRRPAWDGVVRLNRYTFAYDYARRFEAQGLLIVDRRREGDLDAFLVRKRDAKYDHPGMIDPEALGADNVHGRALTMVPPGSRVLDVGCATGYVGRYLVSRKGCRVVGVERDPAAAEVARRHYQEVVTGDVEADATWEGIRGPFDAVLTLAVLEHLAAPERLLARLRTLLRSGGLLLVILPNIAHWSIRRDLLLGRFDYQEYGLLDRTHLRFYTVEGGRRLLEDSGYRVEAIVAGPYGYPLRLAGVLRRIPRIGPRLLRQLPVRFPNFFGYEILYRAVPRP